MKIYDEEHIELNGILYYIDTSKFVEIDGTPWLLASCISCKFYSKRGIGNGANFYCSYDNRKRYGFGELFKQCPLRPITESPEYIELKKEVKE